MVVAYNVDAVGHMLRMSNGATEFFMEVDSREYELLLERVEKQDERIETLMELIEENMRLLQDIAMIICKRQ